MFLVPIIRAKLGFENAYIPMPEPENKTNKLGGTHLYLIHLTVACIPTLERGNEMKGFAQGQPFILKCAM
jgi:hypothetical protein